MISPVYEYRYRWPLQLTGGLFILIGLILGLPGLWLIWLGGSLYYSAAGAALALSGVLLCSGRPTGAWLFAAAVIGTLFWSLWEAGLDGWALLPRLGLFVPLGTLLLVASRLLTGRRIAAGMGLLAAAGVAISLLGDRRPGFLPSDGQTSAQVQIAQAPTMEDTEWPVVGGDPGSTRFSRLHQISPANVSQLQLAWKVHLGFSPSGKPGVLEATPLMVRDLVYTCNMHSEVLALDPETGKTVWRFDPHIDPDAYLLGVCRGVAYYHEAGATGLCGERIISVTLDARMFAVDARTGQRCPHFGNNGEVDLSEGMGVTEKGYYYLTSAPTIVRGKVIVGGLVVDDQYTGEPSGAIRGFDVLTGKFAWVWDMGRPEDHGPPPSGQSFTLGTPNAWGPITGDDQLGLAFVPLGNATPDYVSAHRSAAMNQFTDAVVALDVETGALRWSYQTVHRDVWDYDVASPPTLVEFPTPQGPRPGLIQPTKRGEFFVLDRVTGEPLVETVERAAPQKPVPGETLSPTQPYPVGMPSFGGERLTEANMWGITAFDQLWCRIRFRQARYDGVFTPVGLTPTIIYPGYLGGSEWPGVSVDPDRHLMVLNVSHFAMYDQLISRAEADKLNIRPFKAGQAMDKANNAQAGTPYAVRVSGFVTPLDTPCIKPPYSELAVVDLTTRKVLWRKPLGTARDSGPWNLKFVLPIPMGVPAVGGTLVTRSGLIFIAATQERTFRAFDLKTSELLWQTRLPAGGHAAPMTYYSKRSQRQFLLIPASGHWWMKSGKGDYLLAYTLPEATASRR